MSFLLRDGEPKLILTCATANAEMRGILEFDKTCFLQVSYKFIVTETGQNSCWVKYVFNLSYSCLAEHLFSKPSETLCICMHQPPGPAGPRPPSFDKFWAVGNGIPHAQSQAHRCTGGWARWLARSIVARRESSADFEPAEFARSKSAKIRIWLTNWKFKTFLEFDVNFVLFLLLHHPHGLNDVAVDKYKRCGVAWG